MKNKKNKLNNQGFTLMELLVSTSIFVIIALASLSIYSQTVKVSQKSLALTKVQTESQFIMQVLAKKIRTSCINYDYYSDPLTNPVSELALVDLSGDEYVFKKSNNDLTIAVNGGAEQKIPADNIVINNLRFFINPTSNPFITLDIPPSTQPYVTIVLDVSASKSREVANLVIQQTIPQRAGVEAQ